MAREAAMSFRLRRDHAHSHAFCRAAGVTALVAIALFPIAFVSLLLLVAALRLELETI
jgi:hypothetical protein